MTLEELKAANAAEEAARAAETETDTDEELVEDEEELEGETHTDDGGVDDEGSDPDSETAEDWMRGDDQGTPEAGKKFGDSDVAAAKRKLKAKLEKAHQSEIEELKAELEKLKKYTPVANAPESLPPHPKWEDFADQDNQDAAYSRALVEWNICSERAKADAEAKAAQMREKQAAAQKQISEAVDQHYERAAELAEKSGIEPERYQAADRMFRQAVDSVHPGGGDVIADALISKLGPGSEKVAFNVGINSERREKFQKLLRDDNTGLSAMAYLAELKAQLQSPVKRKSTAKPPAPQASGDNKGAPQAARLKKQYEQAKGQRAYEIRREARKAGIDTSKW